MKQGVQSDLEILQGRDIYKYNVKHGSGQENFENWPTIYLFEERLELEQLSYYSWKEMENGLAGRRKRWGLLLDTTNIYEVHAGSWNAMKMAVLIAFLS